MISMQMARQIGKELAGITYMPRRILPPIHLFHMALETAVPNYLTLTPDEQAELISEAESGWQDHFKEEQ